MSLSARVSGLALRLLMLTSVALAVAMPPGLSSAPGDVGAATPHRGEALPPAEIQNEAPSGASLLFVENAGQFDARARFQVRGGPGTLWLTENALWLTLAENPRVETSEHPGRQLEAEPRRAVNLRLSFPDANPHPRLEPFNRLDSVVHYYRGSDPSRWHTNVPVWSGLRYVDLYPGVDLEVSGEGGRWNWRLKVKREGVNREIRLRVEGADSGRVDGSVLRLTTEVGELTLPLLTVEEALPDAPPVILSAGDGAFEITSPFSSAAPSGALAAAQVSYPEEVYFGSYLGGNGNDYAYAVAVTGQGDILDRGADSRSVWIAGQTDSTNFPTEPGGATLSGVLDAFVTRMKRTAVYVAPAFSAYLGGSDQDAAWGIAADADGHVYVTGWTRSNDLPTTDSAFDRTYNGCVDAFILKMDSDGALLYGSYLGGSHVTIPGLGDQCGDDDGLAIAVDGQGIAYLTGNTTSQDFPTTTGAYDRTYANVDIGLNRDVFVARLSPAGQGQSDLLYSTFVGGGFSESGNDVAVDATGVVYVTGSTGDMFGPPINNDFPTTSGAFDPQSPGSDSEAFVFRLNPAGNGSADLLYSTFLGMEGYSDEGQGIAADVAGQVYVSGKTYSPDFPTTSGALDTTCGTDGNCNMRTDFFVSQLNLAGNGSADLLYATYLGGDLWEGFRGASDIALGADGDVFVTGDTSSTSGFPITADAYDPTGDSLWGDAFVVRLRLQGNGADDLIYGTYVGGSGTEGGRAIALDEADRVYAVGKTNSWDFPTTAHAIYQTRSGLYDTYLFRLLAPPLPDLSTSTKTVDPDRASAGQVVTFTVQLDNSGVISTTASFTDTLPAALLLQGSPTASAGDPPAVNDQIITWVGTVDSDATVTITYATLLTSTATLTPTAANEAQFDDGMGNVYLRRAFVNGYEVFLPLVLR